MKKQQLISPKQAVFLILTMTLSTVDIFLPAELAGLAGRDAWIAALGAPAIGYLIYRVILALGLLFPDHNIAEYNRIILGKYLGGLLTLLYIIGSLVGSATVVVQFSIIMGTAFKPESPPYIWYLTVLIPAVYVVSRGIAVTARMNEVLLPLGLALLLFVVVLNYDAIELRRYLPMFYDGYLPSIKGTLFLGGYMSYSMILMVLLPLIDKKEKLISRGVMTFALLAVALLGGTMAIAIFGPELTAMTLLPALAMIRNVDLGFVTRLDALMITIWYTGIFIFICISIYIPAVSIRSMFGFKNMGWLLVLCGFIVFGLANSYIANVPLIRYVLGVPWSITLYVYSLLLPLLLYFIARLRGFSPKVNKEASEN